MKYASFRHWTEFVKAVQSVNPNIKEERAIRLFRQLYREGKIAQDPEGVWRWV